MDKELLRKIFLKASLAFLIVGAWLFLYAAYLLVNQGDIERSSRLASLLSGGEKVLELDKPTKVEGCIVQGSLPDRNCTPGAVFPEATKEQVCVPGYSQKARNVSDKNKKEVYAMYGISYPQPFGTYELDHLVPLSLGGSNDIANLWPKSAEPFPGFFEKNVVGNYLHEEVCKDNVALSVAQERIANDWPEIYSNLDPQIIERLKNKYPNWANR